MPPRTTRTATAGSSSMSISPPVASTSDLASSVNNSDSHDHDKPAPETGDTGPGKKRKKLPACDACKLRRVLCKPQPIGISCPRCKDKGIVCTTTPTVRKKAVGRSGKRIEEARAMFGTADPTAPELMGASNTPWIQPRLQQQQGQARASIETLATAVRAPKLSEDDADANLAFDALNGALVAHLLELYQALPQSWLPIGVRGRMSLLFESAGRRLEALPPQAEVLAHAMIALTSRLSSHPALFSPGSNIPSFESLTPAAFARDRDLREFGRRRDEACEKLRKKAVKLAWDRGTLVESTEETMASCYLLEMLEGRNNPKGGKPYGSAFVSHLRTLLDTADEPGAVKVMNMSLGWSALMMREAIFAASAGRTSHFTAVDDRILCGDPPLSIEASLLETVDDVDLRDTVTLFFRPFRPYTYHCASLARSLSDNVTGTFARKQPLDELFVTKYLTHLDHLLHLFAVLESRIAMVLSPAATSAHALPAPFEAERQFIMRACLYTLSLAWCGLSLPLYTDLKRRVRSLEHPTEDHIPRHSQPSQQRALSRLRLLREQVRSTTVKAARMVAQTVREAPSLAFLTHLQSENLDKWCELLIETRVVEEGGEGISREERRNDLVDIRDGLLTMGWSWADEPTANLINHIERALAASERPSVGPHTHSHLRNSIMEQDEKMREILQGSPPVVDGLPNPPARFRQGSQSGVSPASSDGFDYTTLLHPSTTAASPASLAMPDLSSLASLFGGPGSASSAPSPFPVHSHTPPQHGPPPPPPPPPPTSVPTAHSLPTPPPPMSQPQTPLGPPPDLSTLISAYLNGTLVLPPGLDVTSLTSSFLMGTLDINSLWATYGSSVTIEGQPIATGGGGDVGSAAANAHHIGTPGSQPQGPTLDFDALLHDELYRGEPTRI
ncbi:Zn(II)2Cys6 transcription factor domain-containing protein [Sporobolomyces koalae]|uniref:Zn(II)2Cys6 transcription factor domain-containing protein n=1 Tax=Sporobolomyces koalae TaxID=500713 RepID=UPI003177081E